MKIIFKNQTHFVEKTLNEYSDLTFDFSKAKAVPDSVRGMLYYKHKEWHFCHNKFFNTETNCKGIKIDIANILKYKRIVVILESPDREEYFDNNLRKPRFPAQGKTGNKIDEILNKRKFVEQLNKKQKYLVLIVNPVQYQASCIKFLSEVNLERNRSLTDKVFRILFNGKKGNQRCGFIKRLNNYKPNFIFNCCTKSLAGVVKTAIRESLEKGCCPDSNVLIEGCYAEDTHPSRW